MQILTIVSACLILGIVISLCIKGMLEAFDWGESFDVIIFVMIIILVGSVGGWVLYGLAVDWKGFLSFTEQLF